MKLECVLTTLFAATLALAPEPLASAAGDDPAGTDVRAEIEAARAELDAAARRLAELHRRAGDTLAFVGAAQAMPIPRSRLGILVGPRQGAGLVVAGVTPGSGAEAAGIVAGDVLIAIDDVPLDGSRDVLLETVAAFEPGATVTVVYERSGERHTASVELSSVERPWAVARRVDLAAPPHAISVFAGSQGPRLHDLDADLARYFGVKGGVLVLDGADDDRGLRSGDVLVAIDGRTPANAAEALSQLLTARDAVAVEVIRDGAAVSLVVDGASVVGPVGAGARLLRIDGMEAPAP
jgi:S1-C subfamily serine protease